VSELLAPLVAVLMAAEDEIYFLAHQQVEPVGSRVAHIAADGYARLVHTNHHQGIEAARALSIAADVHW
jgi:hypothetical protein